MIGPTWFLLLIIFAGLSIGVINILSNLIPADTFKSIFDEILFPIIIISLICIVILA
jgi:hypothetical protein